MNFNNLVYHVNELFKIAHRIKLGALDTNTVETAIENLKAATQKNLERNAIQEKDVRSINSTLENLEEAFLAFSNFENNVREDVKTNLKLNFPGVALWQNDEMSEVQSKFNEDQRISISHQIENNREEIVGFLEDKGAKVDEVDFYDSFLTYVYKLIEDIGNRGTQKDTPQDLKNSIQSFFSQMRNSVEYISGRTAVENVENQSDVEETEPGEDNEEAVIEKKYKELDSDLVNLLKSKAITYERYLKEYDKLEKAKTKELDALKEDLESRLRLNFGVPTSEEDLDLYEGTKKDDSESSETDEKEPDEDADGEDKEEGEGEDKGEDLDEDVETEPSDEDEESRLQDQEEAGYAAEIGAKKRLRSHTTNKTPEQLKLESKLSRVKQSLKKEEKKSALTPEEFLDLQAKDTIKNKKLKKKEKSTKTWKDIAAYDPNGNSVRKNIQRAVMFMPNDRKKIIIHEFLNKLLNHLLGGKFGKDDLPGGLNAMTTEVLQTSCIKFIYSNNVEVMFDMEKASGTEILRFKEELELGKKDLEDPEKELLSVILQDTKDVQKQIELVLAGFRGELTLLSNLILKALKTKYLLAFAKKTGNLSTRDIKPYEESIQKYEKMIEDFVKKIALRKTEILHQIVNVDFYKKMTRQIETFKKNVSRYDIFYNKIGKYLDTINQYFLQSDKRILNIFTIEPDQPIPEDLVPFTKPAAVRAQIILNNLHRIFDDPEIVNVLLSNQITKESEDGKTFSENAPIYSNIKKAYESLNLFIKKMEQYHGADYSKIEALSNIDLATKTNTLEQNEELDNYFKTCFPNIYDPNKPESSTPGPSSLNVILRNISKGNFYDRQTKKITNKVLAEIDPESLSRIRNDLVTMRSKFSDPRLLTKIDYPISLISQFLTLITSATLS
jgi:hypothetical protein